MTICEKCRFKIAEKKVLHPHYRVYFWVCEECEKELKQWQTKKHPQ